MTWRGFLGLVGVWAVLLVLARSDLGGWFAPLWIGVIFGGAMVLQAIGVAGATGPLIIGGVYALVALFLLVRMALRLRDGDGFEARGYAAAVISMAAIVALPLLSTAQFSEMMHGMM